jgi:Leu/Phe-tRNA-protein transferase
VHRVHAATHRVEVQAISKRRLLDAYTLGKTLLSEITSTLAWSQNDHRAIMISEGEMESKGARSDSMPIGGGSNKNSQSSETECMPS